MTGKPGTPFLKGSLLIAAITSVCSSGFLFFGYDQGVMSGIVTSNYWLKAMNNPSTLMVGTITALYDVGAFFGAICATITTEGLGSAVERVQFMVARIDTGVGMGYVTSVTPIYQSQIGAAAHRGCQVCYPLTTMLFGLILAYWINYGVYFQNSAFQWRFPLLSQCVFANYILALTIFLLDTLRWPVPNKA